MRAFWIILLCLVMLSVGCCTGFLTGFVGGAATSKELKRYLERMDKPPDGVDVVITAPDTVAVGDSFAVTVTISNAESRGRNIEAVDIETSLFRGLEITSVSPVPLDDVRQHGFQTYIFNQPLPSSGLTTVTFQCTATRAGVYKAPIDVYVDSELRYVSTPFSLQIENDDRSDMVPGSFPARPEGDGSMDNTDSAAPSPNSAVLLLRGIIPAQELLALHLRRPGALQ